MQHVLWIKREDDMRDLMPSILSIFSHWIISIFSIAYRYFVQAREKMAEIYLKHRKVCGSSLSLSVSLSVSLVLCLRRPRVLPRVKDSLIHAHHLFQGFFWLRFLTIGMNDFLEMQNIFVIEKFHDRNFSERSQWELWRMEEIEKKKE